MYKIKGEQKEIKVSPQSQLSGGHNDLTDVNSQTSVRKTVVSVSTPHLPPLANPSPSNTRSGRVHAINEKSQ